MKERRLLENTVDIRDGGRNQRTAKGGFRKFGPFSRRSSSYVYVFKHHQQLRVIYHALVYDGPSIYHACRAGWKSPNLLKLEVNRSP